MAVGKQFEKRRKEKYSVDNDNNNKNNNNSYVVRFALWVFGRCSNVKRPAQMLYKGYRKGNVMLLYPGIVSGRKYTRTHVVT